MVGTDSVAKAAPDGHTLLLMESSAVLHKWLHKDVPFDVIADFAPVARVATSPLMLFAQSVVCAQRRQGTDRARQGEARQAVGRHARRRHAASSRAADAERARQDRHRQRAVSRRGAGAQRRAGRPDPDELGGADRGDAACRGRQGQGAGRGVGRSGRRRCRRCRPSPRAACRASISKSCSASPRRPRRRPTWSRGSSKEIAEIVDAARRAGAHRARSGLSAGLSPTASKFRAQIRDDHERFGKIIRDAGIAPN